MTVKPYLELVYPYLALDVCLILKWRVPGSGGTTFENRIGPKQNI